jgi:hypothetical protein
MAIFARKPMAPPTASRFSTPTITQTNPAEKGRTAVQVYTAADPTGFRAVPKLTTDLRRLIPNFKAERLPVKTGRFHFMRKVDTAGHNEFLNERWLVGSKWIGEYVRATVNTSEQMLTISHKAATTLTGG